MSDTTVKRVYWIGRGLNPERERFEVSEDSAGHIISVLDLDDDIPCRVVEIFAMGTVFETCYRERFMVSTPNETAERRLYACDWRFAGYDQIAR